MYAFYYLLFKKCTDFIIYYLKNVRILLFIIQKMYAFYYLLFKKCTHVIIYYLKNVRILLYII